MSETINTSKNRKKTQQYFLFAVCGKFVSNGKKTKAKIKNGLHKKYYSAQLMETVIIKNPIEWEKSVSILNMTQGNYQRDIRTSLNSTRKLKIPLKTGIRVLLKGVRCLSYIQPTIVPPYPYVWDPLSTSRLRPRAQSQELKRNFSGEEKLDCYEANEERSSITYYKGNKNKPQWDMEHGNW